MKKLLIILICSTLLLPAGGCVSVAVQETPRDLRTIAASADTFAICKSLDVVSTYVALGKGAVEANPLMAAIMSNFGYAGLIGISAALIYAVYRWRDSIPDEAMIVANGITCGVAVHNLMVK